MLVYVACAFLDSPPVSELRVKRLALLPLLFVYFLFKIDDTSKIESHLAISSHHQGFGMLLMEEAERIAREEHGAWKLAVISGVGTRNYYRKLGYELDGPYMSKMLDEL